MASWKFPRFCRGLSLVFVLLLFGAGASIANPTVNTQDDHLGLNGFDAVAYFTDGEPVRGKAKHEVTHEGARYRFTSEDHQRMFAADPSRYLPRYGGFCSYGVALGQKFDIDPYAYRIVNDKLYLQLDLGTQKIWARDLERNIAIADRVWLGIRLIPVADLKD